MKLKKRHIKKFAKGIVKAAQAGKPLAKPAALIILEVAPIPGGPLVIKAVKTAVDKML